MFWNRFWNTSLCGLMLICAAPTFGDEILVPAIPAKRFEGKELPQPPMAGKDWLPPKTNLSDEWIQAIQHLLKLGFADPRGCEYREVTVTTGSVWRNRGKSAITHAWVLPATETEPSRQPRFAVTWNGMVYPVMRVGAPADLKADVAKLLVTSPDLYQLSARDESTSLWPTSANPLKGCLLLILGEADLAEQAWKQAPADLNLYQTGSKKLGTNPYPGLLRAWAIAVQERAASAHLRGDDVISLLAARQLVRIRDAAEKQLPEQGFLPPKDQNGRPTLFLDFLRQSDALVTDQERRVAAVSVIRVLSPGAPLLADQQTRIAALIRDLEVVDET